MRYECLRQGRRLGRYSVLLSHPPDASRLPRSVHCWQCRHSSGRPPLSTPKALLFVSWWKQPALLLHLGAVRRVTHPLAISAHLAEIVTRSSCDSHLWGRQTPGANSARTDELPGIPITGSVLATESAWGCFLFYFIYSLPFL